MAGNTSTAAFPTKDRLLRNLKAAEEFGCLDASGLAEMRRGNAPTVMMGKDEVNPLSVDHIIPPAVVPELANVIGNPELMPLRVNERKGTKIGDRQRDLAKKLFEAGLLSQNGLDAVLRY